MIDASKIENVVAGHGESTTSDKEEEELEETEENTTTSAALEMLSNIPRYPVSDYNEAPRSMKRRI